MKMKVTHSATTLADLSMHIYLYLGHTYTCATLLSILFHMLVFLGH